MLTTRPRADRSPSHTGPQVREDTTDGHGMSIQHKLLAATLLSFSSRTYFFIGLDSWFYAAAQPSNLNLAGEQVLGTDHFSMQVLNAANQVVQGAAMAKPVPGTGVEVVIPAVPEPSTLMLGLFALLPLWRVARQHANRPTDQTAKV